MRRRRRRRRKIQNILFFSIALQEVKMPQPQNLGKTSKISMQNSLGCQLFLT